MPYTLYNSDGTPFGTIQDGTANGPGFATSTTNLVLPGANFVGYGQYLNQNLIKLLENFASTSAPSAGPNVVGQLWFNKTDKNLYVYQDNTNGFVTVNGIVVDNTTPTFAYKPGTILYRTDLNQVFIYNNSGVPQLVGPQYTLAQGVSGAIPLVLNDAGQIGNTHNVVSLQFGTEIIAIISSDATFTPTPAIPGFATINKGITYNSTLAATSNLNLNITGNVVGNVTGNLLGNSVGNLTGNVVGNVVGNLTGNVVATTITGSLTGSVAGNVTSSSAVITNATVTNLTVSNAQIAGGLVSAYTLTSTGPLYVASSGNFGGAVTANTVNAPFVGNAGAVLTGVLSSGAQNNITSATGLTTLLSTNGNVVSLVSNIATINNLSSSNLQATSGSITGASMLSTTSLVATGATALAGVAATMVTAPTIGNTGATIIGTLSTATQNSLAYANNLVGVGTVNSGTWQGNIVAPAYGGTGVNNGTSTLTVSGNWTINQSVASGAAPVFVGTNFTGNASGMTAGRVVNGVYSTDIWSNPAWITSLAWSKLSGTIPNVSTFNNDANYITSANLTTQLGLYIGSTQTWSQYTSSYCTFGTTYTNPYSRPIMIMYGYTTGSGTGGIQLYINGQVFPAAYDGFASNKKYMTPMLMIPANGNWKVTLNADYGQTLISCWIFQ